MLYAQPLAAVGLPRLDAFHPRIPASLPAAVETNKSANSTCAFESRFVTVSQRAPDGPESGFHKH